MLVTHVVGARPNFIKVSPVMSALSSRQGFDQRLVHTGQHYDIRMSEIFFRQLDLPKPDVNLEIGSGSHAYQTAHVMLRFEDVVRSTRPDVVLVYGDVNSTLAAAIVCSKMGIAIAHVEAGLRSFDRTMPEESNRVLTDHIADLLLTPSKDANENLLREGVDIARIKLVGNVMIDTLVRLLPKAEECWLQQSELLGVHEQTYGLVTLHRASNVDDDENLRIILNELQAAGRQIPLLFPVHPRTRKKLGGFSSGGIHLMEPLGYIEFLCLQKHARFVITDSGGIQEETTYLGVPCITLRKNTERPITVSQGTNCILGDDIGQLTVIIKGILSGNCKRRRIPELWDGKTGERIADCLEQSYARG
jgi:UDP-N-acetylglucosamine 2-epimerase (non-hydrolysing)